MAKSGLAKRGTVSARPLRVLHVEDQRLDAELCLRQLEEAGFELVADVVATREEFLQKLGSNTYDIILSDYRLPGWSGRDALAIVRTDTKDTPFILVTGSLGEEDAVESIKEGATDYVLKDRPERLPMAVRRALEEKVLRQERQRAEKTLRESEARKAAMLESALDCVVAIDDQGRIIEFNPAAEQTFGYSRAEVLGKPLVETIIPPSLRERHQQGFARYLATGEDTILGKRIEMPARRADGKVSA